MTDPATTNPTVNPTVDLNSSHQIQQRLLQLSNQMERIQNQLDLLAASTRANSDQVAALTNGLTDPLAAEATRTTLAQLTTQLVDNEEQLGELRNLLTETITKEQEILQHLQHLGDQQSRLGTQQEKFGEQQSILHEQQSQLEPMLRSTVQSDQLEELAQNLASQSQLTDVLSTIKKLNRTQFKSNAITEGKETQVTDAISTLQTIVNQREEAQTEQVTQTQQRLTEEGHTARGELVAAFLPSLDGLELAIAKGRELSLRLQTKQTEATASDKAKIVDLLQRNREPIDLTFWKRVRSAFGGSPDADKLERNVALDLLSSALSDVDISIEPQSVTAVQSWLDGLNLVRDRFLKLFAAEGVTPIPANGQLFDPRLHVAVETEVRTDMEPETVVRVLQEGYKQRERVLRYAEVVVARKPEENG